MNPNTRAAFEVEFPDRAAAFRRTQQRRLPAGLAGALRHIAGKERRATRKSSQACLDAAVSMMPELVGGSADLAESTGTVCGEVVTSDDYSRNAIVFGIREFGMAAVLNGMSLHGGFRVFGSTFLVFADYLWPALRLSALMRQPVVYVFTHDSIAVGEDGTTHQPVAHIESLRIIPGLQALRPADNADTAAAWRLALERTDGPTALILSRQSVPQRRTVHHDDVPVSVEIVATGSEVWLAEDVADVLRSEGDGARVVSALDRSRYTPDPSATTVSIEAGSTSGWSTSPSASTSSAPADRVATSWPATDSAWTRWQPVSRSTSTEPDERLEAAFVNTVHPGDVVVVGVNGLFGRRMCEVAARCGAEVVPVEHPWGSPVDPERVLAAHPARTPQSRPAA